MAVRRVSLPAVLALGLVPAPVAADEAIYVPLGSTWKYFRGLSEASSPDPAAWIEPEFDDTAWASGSAPFGFGANEGPLGTDLAALDPPMRGSYTTLYLRRRFEVPRLEDVVRLEARVVYDDGFVLWVNGVEVARDNAPETLAFDAVAPRSIEARDPIPFDLPDPTACLREGTNVVAVQTFNQSLSNSDFRIDLALVDPLGPDVTPPEMDAVIPPPDSTVRRADRIEVLFTEDVTGVDASDLLLGGTPALGVLGSGRGPYVFSFPAPPLGEIAVRWADGHRIADLALRPNAFRGGSWTYRVDPTAKLPDIRIAEFSAINRASVRPVVRDEDGEYSDWIEIQNAGPAAADLAGWSLTDDPKAPGKWTFPSRSLDPGACLLVFASGKDRRGKLDPQLHTNFQLASDGEYLGLYTPESPRAVAVEFAPRYPPQRAGASYGLGADGSAGYFVPPTPGEPNGAAAPLAGFVAEPRFVPGRGFYEAPADVEIYSPTPGAKVFYTTDGSEPDPDSGIEYAGPVRVEGTPERAVVVLRAAAFLEGLLPSRSVTHTYIFPEHVLRQPANPPGFPAQWGNAVVTAADYAMDARVVNENPAEALRGLRAIPSLSVAIDVDDLFGKARGIYSNPNLEGIAWERPVSAELVYPDGRKGFQANCGIRIQGGSSTSPWKAYKLSLRLLFRGDYGPSKLVHPLFPDSAVGRFDSLVLDAHLNLTWIHPDETQRTRSQYVRDAFACDLQNAFGSLAPHAIFAHLYLDGLYWGLYEIHERPDDSFAAEHLGGEKEEYDVFRHEYALLVDGERTAWTELFARARQGLATTERYLAIGDYLDVADLADYMLVHIYAGNDDWPRHNWYAARRRTPGAGFRFFSWDSEHILKDVAINQTAVNLAGSPAELYALLRQNPDWRLLFADRAHRHFFGGALYVDPAAPGWDEEHPERNAPAALYMKRIREIDPAIRLESARWGDNRRPAQPYTRDREWMAELNWLLKTYFPRRSAIVLEQLRAAGLYPRLGAPVFSRPGGLVDPGTSIAIALPSGTAGSIYVTVDGSDPRLFGSGFVSPRARLYSGPLTISDTTRLKARTLSGETWSALNEALYVVAFPMEALKLTEILYHPAGDGDLEFLELHNAGAYTLDLSGLWFEDGIRFAFPEGTSLGPGEYFVLVADAEAFSARYPGVPIGGVYEGRLDNAGEKVTLRDSAGRTILSVDYGDEGFWPIAPDGFGHSLVVLDPFGDLDEATNWRASAEAGGSPGGPDPEPAAGGVVVSEVLARAEPPFEAAIELENLWDAEVDIGGWYLSDAREDEASLKKFRIPDKTAIPPGGRAVFYEGQFAGAPGGFSLSPSKGAVYLSSADAAGKLTGYVTGHEFRGSALGVSFGRIERSSGPEFAALEARSFGVDRPATVAEFRTGKGAPNAGPLVGPVVIHEIHYHPPAGEEEFIELHNRTDAAIAVGGWTLSGLFDALETRAYEIPRGAAIPARGFLLVVGVDPAVFRERYGIPADVPIAGPYGGALDNAGETLRLERPYDGPGAPGATIVVDRVRYDDRPPWPSEADGGGRSLERLRAGDHGNEPLNWAASAELGGSPGRPNGAASGSVNQRPVPRFDVLPQGEPLFFLFDASRSLDPDGTIRSFAWSFGDGEKGAGQTVLHGYSAAGTYTVRLEVADDAGAKSASARAVTVRGGTPPGGWQLPGDGTQDGILNLTDAIVFLGRLFLGWADPYGCAAGPLDEGPNLVLLDVNGDGLLNLADPVYILNYLFLGGLPPVLGDGCVRIPGCPDACPVRG